MSPDTPTPEGEWPIPEVPGATADPPISAQLAKRLAATADGFRGALIWIVAHTSALSERPEICDSWEKARDLRDDRGDGWGVYGPYRTLTAEAEQPGRINRVVIEYKNAKGEERAYTIRGEDADALFWSASAMEKFLYPYYTGLIGPAEAALLEEEFRGALGVLHPPLSYARRIPDGQAPTLIALFGNEEAPREFALPVLRRP